MKLTRMVCLTLAGFLFSAATPALAGLDFLEPAVVQEKIRKEVAKASIRGSLNLVDADLYDGISASVRYRIESEPSYVDGYYTRLDRYLLSVGLNPGELLEGNDSPLGFSVEKGTEVIFARQFKSQGASLVAMPYTLKHIPLSAKNAIENLQPGDFVALQANLSVVLSLGKSSSLNGLFDFEGSTHALVSGEFFVHLFRMPDNKMRVKLIAVRSKGASAGVGITLSNFKIVGLKVVDRRIKRWTHINPVNIRFKREISDLFMLDYVFDLNNPQAALAYNELLTKKTRFKDFAIINPVQSREEMRKELMTDLSDIEDLVAVDSVLPPEQRRVQRIFRGANTADTSSARFRIGLSILKLENESAYGQNKVIYYDDNNIENYYLLDTYMARKEFSFLFNLYGDNITNSTNLLFSADKDFAPGHFVAMTITNEMKMKDVSRREFRQLQNQVKQVLPEAEYAKIDWKNWATMNSKVVNGYFREELFFHPEAIKRIPYLNEKVLAQKFIEYIERTGAPTTQPRIPLPYDDAYNAPWKERFMIDIQTLAHNMTRAVNPTLSTEERYKAFRVMKDFGLWQEKGGGFITSIIPSEHLSQFVSYQIVLSGRDADTITYRYGNFAEEGLYRSLMYIQRVINDRSFDLRALTDDKGNPITIK